MKNFISNLFFLFMVINSNAQGVMSPEVHDDGRVTFRYYGPDAKCVRVESGCLLNKPDNSWFDSKKRKAKMTRDQNGVWSLTTSPLIPEVYNYRFVVDGVKCVDPCNPDTIHELLHKESLVVVGGLPMANLFVEREKVAHGKIDTVRCQVDDSGVSRKVLVYVPAVDSTEIKESLPILYLLHGISGDEQVWIEQGRVKQILDNMIANGDISPIMVVMPDCNVVKKVTRQKRTNLFRNIFNYPVLRHKKEFEKSFTKIHAALCSRYDITDSTTFLYMAGLSSGAMQAANIVKENPSMFRKVGFFSPPLMGRRYMPDNSGISSYYVYIGDSDLFRKSGIRLAKRLVATGVECDCVNLDEGHSWRAWRRFLVLFLKEIQK